MDTVETFNSTLLYQSLRTLTNRRFDRRDSDSCRFVMFSGTMKPTRTLTANTFYITSTRLPSDRKWVSESRSFSVRFPVILCPSSRHDAASTEQLPSPAVLSGDGSDVFRNSPPRLQNLEENIEKVIYGCRFLTILAVWGSLIGSFLCFIKGCTYVGASFQEYFVNRGKMILLLVEAIDVYLLGTVMLVFGTGLYELFISNLDIGKLQSDESIPYRSNLFGLFTLKERPKWLEIKTLNELKTKLGHVIVMLLLIGLFDKSKKAVIHSPLDLLCFSASILLSSGCLYLLSKLNGSKSS